MGKSYSTVSITRRGICIVTHSTVSKLVEVGIIHTVAYCVNECFRSFGKSPFVRHKFIIRVSGSAIM